MATDADLLALTYSIESIPEPLREAFDTWMTGKTFTKVNGEDRFWKQDVDSFLLSHKSPANPTKLTGSTKILILGDAHGYWMSLNQIVKAMRPDLVLQCGDFGYFPKFKLYCPENRLANRAPIHWCDGNHEDHESLAKFRSDPPAGHEVATNVFYQERGSTLTLPDGRTVLFMGGADSIDKKERTSGRDWFPEELITEADLARLPDCRVDIVISHTCPTRFDISEHFPEKEADPSRKFLDVVLDRYKPARWYFGHWHKFLEGKHKNCRWKGLNSLNRHGGFAWLGEGKSAEARSRRKA